VRGNLSIGLIRISFMAKNVERFFMYLLAICTYFLNCLIHLPINWIVCSFSVLIFGVLYILWILIIHPLNSWQRYFPHSASCLLIRIVFSFAL
jgi:hypothetical protein